MKKSLLLAGVLSLIILSIGCSKDGGGGSPSSSPAAGSHTQLTRNAWCIEYLDDYDRNIQERHQFTEDGIVQIDKYEVGPNDTNRIRGLQSFSKRWEMSGSTLREVRSNSGKMNVGAITYSEGSPTPLN